MRFDSHVQRAGIAKRGEDHTAEKILLVSSREIAYRVS